MIKECETIIWDFDGVIKDSVNIKGNIFRELFLDQEVSLQERILNHHYQNGGISRFKKLKIYLDWSNHDNSDIKLKSLSRRFSELVFDKVINSKYIPGIFDYLYLNHKRQNFFLVTATPQEEIIRIAKYLKIFTFFKEIIGYPTNKEEAFKNLIINQNLDSTNLIVIGDSISEYRAAKKFNLKFILKVDELTCKIPEWYIERDLIIKNFLGE